MRTKHVGIHYSFTPLPLPSPLTVPSGRYTSTWVDEMSQFMRSNQEDLDLEEEDYSDLEDFVASDDEFLDDGEEGQDYSSEIRKLFRYDPRR